ncbi:MAG: PAS-domain containing protein [Pseudomonadota bacterium]
MTLIDPTEPLEQQNRKLRAIADALMHRVEQKHDQSSLAYAQFERAALLDALVEERTKDLERTLDLLHESNRRLARATAEADLARENLAEAIETIREGFALFDSDERLVLHNSRFSRGLIDTETALRPGTTFADYIAAVSRSPALDLSEDETPESWVALRAEQHRSPHAALNIKMREGRWLQVSEHRTKGGGTVILQTDVTDLILNERQEQGKILRATLDHLNQGVCIFDRHRKLVGWNRRMTAILGLPLDQTEIGRDFADLLTRFQGQLHFDGYFDADRLLSWASRRSYRGPISFSVTTHADRFLAIFAQEMPDGGFVMSFTDVTAEREAAQALADMNEALEARVEERTEALGHALDEAERANASKSRFVAAASHDLLQPLSAAKLFLGSLSERLETPEDLAILTKAETALGSAEQIIDALLDISRLDSGKASFDIGPVYLNAVLDPLRDELAPVAAAKGLELRIVPSSLTIQSDPGYLRRILQNLIGNALRYTDTGRVVVGARRGGGSARLEVWDTGRGIRASDQGLVFQEFRRLDGDDAAEGLGLGLAIVERACKGLDHPLSLWSEPGQGSCFAFEVPVRSDPGVRPVPAIRAPETRLSTSPMVLLVENDDHMAQAVGLMFDDWGADLIHAASAAEAVDLLAAIDLRPDALVLDYQLGEGADGLALHGELIRRHGAIPACIVSADRSATLRTRVAEAGLELIPKPINRQRLFAFVERATAPTASARLTTDA